MTTTKETPDQAASRKAKRRKLKDDFSFYGPNALKIRPKDVTQGLLPLKFNAAQLILHAAIEKQLRETGRIRVVVLKGRQQGLSTYIGGRLYFTVSQRKATKAMVLAHKAKATAALFDMTKRYHENCPTILQPHTKYSSKTELVFDKLDSGYMVATAGGDGIGRSETLQHVHASEVAFWPRAIALENWNGLTKAVPNAEGTSIYVESTANGFGDLFHTLWSGAVDGSNGFIPVFIPWFVQEEYAQEPNGPLTYTPEERKLIARYGLNDAQLYWRRLEIANTSLDLFRQEYPCTPDEAFLTSGRPVFNPEQLKTLMDKVPLPLRILALEGDAETEDAKWEEHSRGELVIYRELDPEETYTVGADVGGGVKGDPSVAQVLDSKNRQVAKWRGTVLPDYYGHVLHHLGKRYNWAMLGVEANNHGILPLHILSKVRHYPNLYQDTIYDTVTETETKRLGFTTDVKSKPMLIDKLRGGMRKADLDVVDKTTLGEMQTFVMTEKGRMEAQAGCHDDCVMSLGIAYHVNEQGTGYVETKDEHYVEAI